MISLHNIHYRTFTFSLYTLILSLFIFSQPNFSKNSSPEINEEPEKIFQKVKYYYGEYCSIGVHSSIIDSLYRFADNPEVNKWLSRYESLTQRINEFRNTYLEMIENDAAFILDHSRVFAGDEINFVNAAGIYLGPENVTSISLSYLIVRTGISGFYEYPVRFLNFDPDFKAEISVHGLDWYNSLKLKQLQDWDDQ